MALKSLSFLKSQNMRGFRRGCARFSPIDISSTSVWLDPTYGLYQERSSPTTLCGDGDPVGTWIARTGQSAIAPSNAARPVYRTNSGIPYLDFDGVDDSLVLSGYNLPQPLTGIMALKTLSTAAKILYQGTTPDTGDAAFFVDVTTGFLGMYGGGPPFSVITSSAISSESAIYSSVFNGASSGTYKNGVNIISGTIGGAGTNGGLYIMSNSAGNYNSSDTHDIMFFGSALSASDRSLVEQYLGNRYGITVV